MIYAIVPTRTSLQCSLVRSVTKTRALISHICHHIKKATLSRPGHLDHVPEQTVSKTPNL